MMRLFLALCMLCLAGVASAQTVVVRSGEHGTFTRLTLDLPSRAEWRLEPKPGGARIVFPGSDVDFDITRVFDRINRNRLRAIAPERGRLDLGFACDCDLAAFWHGDSMLVFDIAKAVPSDQIEQTQSSVPSSNLDIGIRPLSTATYRLSRALETRLPPRRDADSSKGSRGSDDSTDLDISVVRQQLVRQLGQAASQGLLTPTRTPVAEPERMPDSVASAKDTQALKTDMTVEPAYPPMKAYMPSGPRGQSRVEPEIRLIRNERLFPDPMENCVPVGWVDLPSWGSAAPFHHQIGPLNRQLLREFDRPDGETVLDLARAYLYFGFGTEANHVLDFRPEGSPENEILRELASIMHHAKTSPDARIAMAAGCGEPAVLWALLAMPILPKETVFDHKALLRSFSALPAHLRDTFGPELARRLIEAQHAQTAQSILRTTERTGGTDASDLALARADLANANGDHDTALMELNEAVAKNSDIAPQALAQLIEKHIANDIPVPFDKAELAGAYAFENRGTELGRVMTRTYVLSLGASGAFGKAVSEFYRLRPDFETTGVADIAASLVQQMTRDADDVTFLRHVLSDDLIKPDTAPAPLAVEIATRLLESGFPAQAKSFVAAGLPGREVRMSQLVRARIALLQQRPRQAEVELLGLDDTAANVLRAEAKSQVGDHTAAQALYIAGEQSEKAAEAAWLAQDLDALGRSSDPVLRRTAEVLQAASQKPLDASLPSLEHYRGLLESASTLRTAMNTLLDTKQAPENP
jgi:hypothetical protein